MGPTYFWAPHPTISTTHWPPPGAAHIGALDVGLVIDCRAGADDHALWARQGIAYLNVGVEDSGAPLPDDFFTTGAEAALEHWVSPTPGRGVFVHCQHGQHRSPALALAILLLDGTELDDAVAQVSVRAAVGDRYFPDAVRWFQFFLPTNRRRYRCKMISTRRSCRS